MSEHEDSRELTGSAATDAIAKAFPRVLALNKAQRELEAAAQSCLVRNIGTPGQSIGGHVYALVRLEDLDALHEAIEQLAKARAM